VSARSPLRWDAWLSNHIGGDEIGHSHFFPKASISSNAIEPRPPVGPVPRCRPFVIEGIVRLARAVADECQGVLSIAAEELAGRSF
jgi:hypothetical protein